MRISCSVGKAATLVALALLTVGTLSACAGGAPAAAGSGVPSLSVSSPSTATSAPTVTATATTPATPVTTSYDAARVQWQSGATAISADQGIFWSAAIADLTAGETTDSDPTGYPGAVVALKELVALPDAQQTPAQNAAYHTDINNLNLFFTTPGLYS